LCLFLPPTVQNVIGFVGLTFFLEQYRWNSNLKYVLYNNMLYAIYSL
jgi:hypothetical protein